MLVLIYEVTSLHARAWTYRGVAVQEGEADLKLDTKCALCCAV